MQQLKLSPEKKKAEQDKKRLYMKRCCEAESIHKAATQKNNDNVSKTRKHQNESTDAAATQKNKDNASRKENARMKVLMQPQHKKQRQCIKEKKTPTSAAEF